MKTFFLHILLIDLYLLRVTPKSEEQSNIVEVTHIHVTQEPTLVIQEPTHVIKESELPAFLQKI